MWSRPSSVDALCFSQKKISSSDQQGTQQGLLDSPWLSDTQHHLTKLNLHSSRKLRCLERFLCIIQTIDVHMQAQHQIRILHKSCNSIGQTHTKAAHPPIPGAHFAFHISVFPAFLPLKLPLKCPRIEMSLFALLLLVLLRLRRRRIREPFNSSKSELCNKLVIHHCNSRCHGNHLTDKILIAVVLRHRFCCHTTANMSKNAWK